jgi:hypothetical protein
MARRIVVVALGALLAAGCADYDPGPESYIYNYAHYTKPEPASFVHCYNYTCRTEVTTFVTPQEFADITAELRTPSATPLEERLRIKRAIARWEQVVGARTGTWRDKREDDPADDSEGSDFQLDCMDEAFNTSSYLMMMNDAGLLHWHKILYPHSRGVISAFGLPHHSATIQDKQTGRLYVVDSWFYDNGQPPVIMPVEVWEKGYSPRHDGAWTGED